MSDESWREDLHQKFIHCDCGNEILQLSYWKDDLQLNLSMYEQHKPTAAIRDKLRWIWRIITKNTPFEDEICLDRAQVLDMVEFCNEYLEAGEE
jgi:hypothetical protein